MRKHFPGHYLPTEPEAKDLWNTAYFTFDANVLLDIFRYSRTTRDRLLNILERLSDRLWLPYQAAAEFHKHRLNIIAEQVAVYDVLREEIDRSLTAAITAVRRHNITIPDPAKLEGVLDRARLAVGAAIDEMQKDHPDDEETERIYYRLTDLFEGRVGDRYAPEDHAAKIIDAKERLDKQIPPGYEDNKKPEPDRYGDMILWSQLLDFARSNDKPLVLVTEDAKEDWWTVVKGKTKGPRPELIEEMALRSNTKFHMYNLARFMEWAAAHFGLGDQTAAIEEINILAESRREVEGMPETDVEGKDLDYFAELEILDYMLSKTSSWNEPHELFYVILDQDLKQITIDRANEAIRTLTLAGYVKNTDSHLLHLTAKGYQLANRRNPAFGGMYRSVKDAVVRSGASNQAVAKQLGLPQRDVDYIYEMLQAQGVIEAVPFESNGILWSVHGIATEKDSSHLTDLT